jgi:hypothetical protein
MHDTTQVILGVSPIWLLPIWINAPGISLILVDPE